MHTAPWHQAKIVGMVSMIANEIVWRKNLKVDLSSHIIHPKVIESHFATLNFIRDWRKTESSFAMGWTFVPTPQLIEFAADAKTPHNLHRHNAYPPLQDPG